MKVSRARHSLYRHQSGGSVRWLTTFNDMMTLLMVFFVLLFSMGSMDMKRFHNFQNALQSAMGVLHEGRRASMGVITKQAEEINAAAAPVPDKASEPGRLEELDATPGLEAEYTPRGIQLTLNDNLLFASGSAILTGSGLELLNTVARIIGPLQRYVRVEGHTDDDPIRNQRFQSNWGLSTARAVQVVKYLAQSGRIAPKRLSAAGYGDSKPRVPNNSAANKSKNRRVEIILGQIIESPVDVLKN